MNSYWRTYSLVPVMVIAGSVMSYATQYLTVEQAQKICFPGTAQFIPSDVTFTQGQMRAIAKDSGVRVRLARQKVWRVNDGDSLIGWFIQDEVLGKHEFITWILALNADGSVKRVEILDYRETYGYQVRDEWWRDQFIGKQHGASLKLDDDIKNIGGATLSSRHITDGVKRLLSVYDIVLRK